MKKRLPSRLTVSCVFCCTTFVGRSELDRHQAWHAVPLWKKALLRRKTGRGVKGRPNRYLLLETQNSQLKTL